eukprot:scaffold128725_cov62-Attheya_sp.AAC.5
MRMPKRSWSDDILDLDVEDTIQTVQYFHDIIAKQQESVYPIVDCLSMSVWSHPSSYGITWTATQGNCIANAKTHPLGCHGTRRTRL